MKYVYILWIILGLSGCDQFAPVSPYKISNYERMADKITAQTVRKIEAETGLRLCGMGGGMMNHVRSMSLSFDYLGEMNMEQGRELMVYCVNEYLSAINNHLEIRPYLIQYPFTPKNVQIRIFIRKANGQEVSSGSLTVVCAIEGSLKYKIKQADFQITHRESFEEAVSILEKGGSIQKIRKNTYHL